MLTSTFEPNAKGELDDAAVVRRGLHVALDVGAADDGRSPDRCLAPIR
jgi:hypothetical protein